MSDWASVVIDVSKMTQKQIVAEAKRLHGQVMKTPPAPVGFVRHVDGAVAPEEAVKLGGVIVYDYSRLDLVKKLALEILEEFSPRLTGEYIRGHRIVMDTPTEVRITNSVPYARVIEIGKRGKVVLKFRNGGAKVYDKTARKLRRDPALGNSVNVKAVWTESATPSSIGAGREERRSALWPTLIITAAI